MKSCIVLQLTHFCVSLVTFCVLFVCLLVLMDGWIEVGGDFWRFVGGESIEMKRRSVWGSCLL